MAVRRPGKPPVTLAKTASPKAPEAPAKAEPAKPAPAKAIAPAPAPAKPAPAPVKPVAAKPAAAIPAAAKPAAKPIEIKSAEAAPVVKPPAPAAKPPAPAAKPASPAAVTAEPPAQPVAAKAAEPPVKAVPVAAMDMSGVQDNLRKAASKTLEQGRAAFERMKEASDEATHTIEASMAATSKGAAELASRALEVTKINANATFDHLKALAGAKTLADAVAMHGQFIRSQSEAAVAQAKEFAELARKAAMDAAAPIQAQMKKAQAK